MSYCLHIPLNEPLCVSDLTEAVERELATLLNWPEPLRITATRTTTPQGKSVPPAPVSDAASATPTDIFAEVDLHLEGAGSAHVVCLLPGETGDLAASISRRGSSKVLIAACAIALSRLSGRPIGGDTYILDTRCNADWNAASVLEILRCRHAHATLEGAAEEVSTTIKRRQAGY